MSAVEERCVAVADTVVPKYRHGTRAYSCCGHVAKMWQAAYDGAAAVLTTAASSEERVGARDALQAQEDAEATREKCVNCAGEGQWEHCPSCSLSFGRAIDLRRGALASTTTDSSAVSGSAEGLREALKPFAALASYMAGRHGTVIGWDHDRVTYDDFRNAAAALAALTEGQQS